MSTNSYSGSLSGNIMIIGKTGSGKTSLVQRWGLNNFFDVSKVYWISTIQLNEERKIEIDSCFKQEVVFATAPNVDKLERIIQELIILAEQKIQNDNEDLDSKDEESNDNSDNDVVNENDDKIKEGSDEIQKDNDLGEKSVFDNLIVFDDMSTIADRSKVFAHFLTVSRKFKYICVYIFHIMTNKNSDTWHYITSQTHIYCFLNLGSLNAKLRAILGENCIRTENDRNLYLTKNNMWLTKLVTSLFNNTTKEHILIDNRETCGKMCKVRSRTDELNAQICFYPIENDNRYFNKYKAVRKDYNNTKFVLSHLVGDTFGGETINCKVSEDRLKSLNTSIDNINNLNKFIEKENNSDTSDNGRSELYTGTNSTTTTPNKISIDYKSRQQPNFCRTRRSHRIPYRKNRRIKSFDEFAS